MVVVSEVLHFVFVPYDQFVIPSPIGLCFCFTDLANLKFQEICGSVRDVTSRLNILLRLLD